MSLTAGTRLGPYEILAPIGAGGMGEVYRARDIKLGRDVAIKVLPESFAHDVERMVRFEREAQVLASLNHPHIATIHGLEESNGVRALVMELVEGPTLAERIGHQAMSLDEVLPIAKQIAEGLEYAHERGIIHRDLKPANVKLTVDGNVKILDFGLAKALETPTPQGNPSISPTLTLEGTRAGVILGTAAYMAPEQARGAIVDKRADIWAFGVVLFEMLTGVQPFAGPTVSDTLASVLTKEPELERVPAKMRRLVRRCLEKDPKRRLRDIGEARITIEESASGASREAEAVLVTTPQRRNLVLVAVAATLAIVSIGLGAVAWRATRPTNHPLIRLNVDLGPDAVANAISTATISPDGTRLVFLARGSDSKQQLFTRPLHEAKASPLSGTENASNPFFSPDGQWIGFFASGKMKKIGIQGGAPTTLCDAPAPRGASWGEDGGIVVTLSSPGGLSRVPTSGGNPQVLTNPADQGGFTDRWPQILPGGQAVLFTTSNTNNFEEANIDVLSFKTGQRKNILRGGYFGRYLPTSTANGHLVYVHQGTLFAVPFDPARLEMRGSPAPLLEDVAAGAVFGAGQFDFSKTGVFLYLGGKASGETQVVWLDSSGKMQTLLTAPGGYQTPRLSPNGKQLAISGASAAPGDLWIYDWQRDSMSRLTFNGYWNTYPVWTPDAKHIVFRSSAGGGSLWCLRTDGGGQAQELMDGKGLLTPYSFSPDGHHLAFDKFSAQTGYDLWTLPFDTSDSENLRVGKPELFLQTPANERLPAFSPDGHWIAYESNEAGSYEVYVRPYPGPGGKWQISAGGGDFPIWSRTRHELLYRNPDNRIMVADYKTSDNSFEVGKPRLWSDQQIWNNGLVPSLDLSPDGTRIAVLAGPGMADRQQGSIHVTFLLNFFDELRRRAPAGGK